MDVGHLREVRSGSAFLAYGTGDVRIKILGDQDEDVDIDDGETDTAPCIDASLAGATGGGTGVGTTPAPGVGVANVVSSTSSHGRREIHTAGSQASIGRQTLPQLTTGEDGSSKYSDGSVPKVSMEGTTKRVHANELRIRISETSGRVRRLSSVQTLSKRKALETGTSTSTPTERAKLHGNSCDSSDIVRKNSKTEEVQPREIAIRTRKEDLPLKRKEIIKDGDGEGSDKCPRASEMVREKRPRMLVLGDESDEDMLERDEAPASPKSDGEGKKVSGVRVAAEMSLKNDSHAVGFGKTGLAGSGNIVVGKQTLLLAGENNLVPLRSAFPLHAKKKVHPAVPGDSKSITEAGFAAHITDENSPRKRIPCTECKRIRLVNADEDLKTPSCCCERNTRNPMYTSRSAPQELNDHCKGEEIHGSKLKLRSERDAGKDGQEILDQKSQFAKEKAQRNMVWMKLQVGGKDFWWPGLIVTVVPPAIQKKIDESVDTPKAVRLFHPRKDVEEYQVVKRSSLKPFHLCLSYKDSSSHPDFIVAVIEADQYVSQPDSQMEGFSQLGTSSKEGPRLSGSDDYARCKVDVPHEHAGSNELVLEDVEMPGIDPQCSQVQTENEKETLEDGEVNQAPVEKGTLGGVSPDARNGSGLSDKRDDLQFSQPQANNEKGVLEDEEVLQVPVGQGKAEYSLEAAGHGDVSSFKTDSQCSPSQGDQVENGMPDSRVVYCTATDQGNYQTSPEATNGFDMSYKRDDVSSSTMNEMDGSKKFQTDAIVKEDLEASDRIKASESSGIEEPFDPFMLNMEITPTRRLIAYDDNSRELYFEDGTAVSIDTVSLGKEFNKCSTGLSPHECIYHIGEPDVRSRFPKGGRSSGGLNFNLLDPNADFATRLRDTWLREYKDEPMPENLRMRFVAACIVEERGEPVNWAFELANSVRAEIKQHDRKKRDSLSPGVLKLIVHLLEKQAPPAVASLPVFEAVKEEEAVDFTVYDHYCHQCKHGGELLCCDGRGCRKTFHLQCLDPPLEEVPETAFYCPSCLAKASTPPEGGTSRAAVFAGLATQTAVQPLANQQAPQQISGRPRPTVVPAHASISRSTTNTVNAGSGITMQPPGTSSTRVSTSQPEIEEIQVLAGTMRSGDSSIEQGLGWVLVSPVPESGNVVTLMPQNVICLSDSDVD